jgi:hypothetical protein
MLGVPLLLAGAERAALGELRGSVEWRAEGKTYYHPHSRPARGYLRSSANLIEQTSFGSISVSRRVCRARLGCANIYMTI